MLDRLTVDDFLPDVGQAFVVGDAAAGEASARLELVSATVLQQPARTEARAGFSLLLRAPRDFGIAQGVYPVHHPRLGRLDLFMVPVGATTHAVEYEAVFN